MNYTVNVSDIAAALEKLNGEATAKKIQEQVLADFCSGVIPDNYASERSFRQTIQRKIEDYCPQAEGFDAERRDPKFIRLSRGLYRLSAQSKNDEVPCAEELPGVVVYPEGSTKRIVVNAYERNSKARLACIAHYGCQCFVCGFSYEKAYGELGKSFIHVHHLKQLSDIGGEYHVDPINDLRPLCANCHAMVHLTLKPLPLDELKSTLLQAQGSGHLAHD